MTDDIVTAASMLMRAEVYSFCNNDFSGVLYGKHLKKPYEFISILHMISKMDEIFDSKKFPEAFLTQRVFGVATNDVKKHEVGEVIIMDDASSAKANPTSSSPKCTFEIEVKYRQNATWQGQIHWVDKNLKQNFRSVLEMLKLMDEAITDTASEHAPVTWDQEKRMK